MAIVSDEQYKIGVVMINYNQSTFDTIECIESLLVSGCEPRQICVVDNHSKSEYADYLQRSIHHDIFVLWMDCNVGFSAGSNAGIDYFKQRKDISYILLLNNDTIVPQGFLSNLVKPFLTEGGFVSLVTPIIYNYDNKDNIWAAGGRYSLFFGSFVHNTDPNKVPFNTFTDTEFASGCCMLFKKDLVKRIGCLDEDYFLYIEDIDFIYRLRKAKHRIVLNTMTYIYHKSGRSSESGSLFKLSYIFNSNKLFRKKHYSGIKKYIYLGILYGGYLHGCIKLLIKGQYGDARKIISIMTRRTYKGAWCGY